VFFLVSCKSQKQNNVYPIQKAENYNGNSKSLVWEKILGAPEIIINSLNKMDNVSIYSSYELNSNEKQLFMDYYNLLPMKYTDTITEKVIGIYFIKNFLGGGMTLPVFDNNGDMYIVLFFNPEILHKTISEWINFRDNSAFISDSTISIITVCSGNYYALIHTLVHEATHVYDYYNHITPFTEKSLKNNKTKFPTDFVNGVWRDYDIPFAEYDFEDRKYTSFYGLGEKIDKKSAVKVFTLLKHTPFNSLYGSKTWAEDFAESFTWYYLNNYYSISYITTIEDKNHLIIYDPNENELVKRRYKIFEEIVK